jgi:hypothetical protein
MTDHNRARNKKVFLKILALQAGNVTKACAAAKVWRGTYYLWAKEDPEFAQAVQHAKESCKDFFEGLLLKEAKAGNTTAIMGWLNANAKDRGYGYNRVEHSGPGGGPIQHVDLSGKTPAQIREIMRAEVVARQGKQSGG